MRMKRFLRMLLLFLPLSCGRGGEVRISQLEDGFRNIPDSVQTVHRTFILRDAIPAISKAFNVTNIRVVTQG